MLRVLRKIVSQPPPSSPGRQALLRANAKLASAQEQLRLAEEAMQRLQNTGSVIAQAEHEAVAAEKLAAESARKWGTSGAPSDGPIGDQTLFERAASLRRAADDARSRVAAASEAAPELFKRIAEARSEVGRAEGEKAAAIDEVMLEAIESDIAQLRKASKPYIAAFTRLHAVREMAKWHRHLELNRVASQLDELFVECCVPVPHLEELVTNRRIEQEIAAESAAGVPVESLKKPAIEDAYLDFAARLRRDPDARL